MPEIQEEIEAQHMNKPTKSFPTEIENTSTNNKTFDLSNILENSFHLI